MRKTLKDYETQFKTDHLEEKLKMDIEKYTENLKCLKIKKFQRDENDYKEGKVYNWNKRTPRGTEPGPHGRTRSRTVSFNLTSSEEDEHATGSATTTSEDFLGAQNSASHPTIPARGRGRTTGRARGRGEHDGGGRNPEPRNTRSRNRFKQ